MYSPLGAKGVEAIKELKAIVDKISDQGGMYISMVDDDANLAYAIGLCQKAGILPGRAIDYREAPRPPRSKEEIANYKGPIMF